MIEYRTLTKVELSFDTFMKMAMDHNGSYSNLKKASKNEQSDFFGYLVGLAQFGQMVSDSDRTLTIYRRNVRQEPYDRVIYYAIDATGLSHGYIYGPTADFIENFNTKSRIWDKYYGCKMEKCTYVYDCVTLMGVTEYENSRPVNLDFFKHKFLPLEKKEYFHLFTRYFPANNKHDISRFGPVIYQSNERSFYLPFVELCQKQLDIKGGEITVNPKFEKDVIYLEVTNSWKTRKHDNWANWKCKISYETFDIIEKEFIGSDSEHNW